MNKTSRQPVAIDMALAILQGVFLAFCAVLFLLFFSAIAIDHGNLTQENRSGIILSSVVLATLGGGMFAASVVKKHSLLVGMAVGLLLFLFLLLIGYIFYPTASFDNNGVELLFSSLVGGSMAKIFSQKKKNKY